MSTFILVAAVVFVLMAKRLADMYVGEEYVCPTCGARSQARHSPDCPWSRFHSG
jgi:hypothetical protein